MARSILRARRGGRKASSRSTPSLCINNRVKIINAKGAEEKIWVAKSDLAPRFFKDWVLAPVRVWRVPITGRGCRLQTLKTLALHLWQLVLSPYQV